MEIEYLKNCQKTLKPNPINRPQIVYLKHPPSQS